jgi:hypothetical protein
LLVVVLVVEASVVVEVLEVLSQLVHNLLEQ